MTSFRIRHGSEDLRRKLCEQKMPPLAARILSAREITAPEDAVPLLETLPRPDFLPDIDKTCHVLAEAIREQKKICVIGDYDADGLCASALTHECLQELGAQVTWQIPSRLKHGYGLHEAIVEQAAKDGIGVLLTVDNGISANQAVARAKALNITVCVTDHHLPPEELPNADCIVNPKLTTRPEGANLSGSGVAFYVMAALRRHMQGKLKMNQFLDLAAVGTVADCMPMDAMNRTIVGAGLEHMRRGRRHGLAALAGGKRIRGVTCRDISHHIAPRINAAGRFDCADRAMACLLAKTNDDAQAAARELSELNDRRKETVKEIMAQTETMNLGPPAAVAANEAWPPGVSGIVAGRLANLHQCPAVVFSRCNDIWRGSGRAPPEWDLHALTTAVAEECGTDIILGFGGHRRAVGISASEIEPVKRAFIKHCERLKSLNPPPQWEVDETPPMSEITPHAVAYLERMVWGEEFERPLFAGEFSVSDQRQVGRGHLRMWLRNGDINLPAIAFNRVSLSEKAEAVFSLTCDHMTGKVMAVVEEILSPA